VGWDGLALLGLSGVYMAFLMAVAWRSERKGKPVRPQQRRLVYGLSLAVYCTSWTFFGAVGTAVRSGWDYLPIYIGPALVLTAGFPVWKRIASAVKRENTGSVADFLSARYGKSPLVGGVAAAVCLIGATPYIALQLRSLTMSLSMLTGAMSPRTSMTALIAAVLAVFAMIFGARRIELTEHNPGLIRAIAAESIVKISALSVAAIFALILLAGRGDHLPALASELSTPPHISLSFLTQILLAAAAMICLPRQFHVGFVELEQEQDLSAARVTFPLYLALTCLTVAPLASAGVQLAPEYLANPDMFVLALPYSQGATLMTALVYIGGFSAATAMVVVETVALSAMASNQFVLPVLTRRFLDPMRRRNLPATIMGARRASIAALLFVACLYSLALNTQENLASIGLISFAAVAQLAPALIGGVYWTEGHSRGAVAGLVTGFGLWLSLLAAPQLMGPQAAWSLAVTDGFKAFGMDTLTGGALVSLLSNTAVYIFVSRRAEARAIDLVQAQTFVHPAKGSGAWADVALGHQVGGLEAVVARFLGAKTARRGFAALGESLHRRLDPAEPVDGAVALGAELMLAADIGASSARGVVAEALSGEQRRPQDVARLIDSAAEAVQFNRELLQAALDNLSQGVSVVNEDLRLIAWNRQYVQMFDLPPEFVHVGRPVADVIRLNAERSGVAPDAFVERRLQHLRRRQPHVSERVRPNGRVLRLTGAPIPKGGYLTSYTDISELRGAMSALETANEQLETRVIEHTEALADAKAEAEAATASKTRFLAAASHDLLQPLHAARLFLAALASDVAGQPAQAELVRHADQSIDSAHRLLRALLNLSKLEAGGVKPTLRSFALKTVFEDLAREFAPQARAKGLSLRFVGGARWVRSDRDLIRSVLQNLISNALQYTAKGGVLVACRKAGARLRLEVWDTGVGIAPESQGRVFTAFVRLPGGGGGAGEGGVGLGLSIVAKIAEILGETVSLSSRPGRGAVFRVTVAPATGRASQVASLTSGPVVPADRKGLRVLCVDNEPAILKGLSAALARMNAEVVTASGREEALGSKGRFDLALVDFHLSDGDGLDLLGLLRDRVRRFVVVTADTSEAVSDRVAAAGVELVHKPIRPEALKALVMVREG
jgi:Na+/proline symporter/signal transduction histidine kinase